MTVFGIAVKMLSETFAGALESSCLAVDGENKRKIDIGQLVDVVNFIAWFAPAAVFAMIAVLQHKGAESMAC